MILLTWYLKTGIFSILHSPVRLGGLLVSVVCSFTSPSFVPEIFSPSLEWENYFERKVRHSSCNLCSSHLLSLWGDPLRHGGLIRNMHGTEVSSGLSGNGFGPRNSIWMSGHKTSPIVLGLYDLSSALFWLFLSVWRREETRNMLYRTTTLDAGGWWSTSSGSGTDRKTDDDKKILSPVWSLPLEYRGLLSTTSQTASSGHMFWVLLARVLSTNLFLMRDSVFTPCVVFHKIYSWLMSRTITITHSQSGIMRFSSFICSVLPQHFP